MTPAATTVLAALLTALVAAPAARRLQLRRSLWRGAPQPVRRSGSSEPDYATLLNAIARQVRSGSSLTHAALEEVDRAPPLGVIVDQVAAGRSFAEALAGVSHVNADLALTVQALSAGAHLGGPVGATLDEAAAVLRERAGARAERRAQAAQARLSARVLTIVPVAFAVWSATSSRRTRDVYFSTAGGAICALCGLMLNVAGWRWMRRIVGPR